MDNILNDFNPQALMKHVEDQEAMALWSENKKELFVGTFTERSDAARYILIETAKEVLTKAMNRKFISQKHWDTFFDKDHNRDRTPFKFVNGRIGERSADELLTIAKERAKRVLSTLPPLKKAVEIIQPEAAKWIDQREKLIEEGDKLKDKFDEYPSEIRMSDQSEDMTIKQFKKLVEDTISARNDLISKLNKIGEQGCELEDKINKALYAGLPGLSEAVIKVAQDHMDRAKALDQMVRRVAEQVRFGDSKAALELLKGFEKDEAVVSDEIKSEFSTALETLKLVAAGGKKVKELKGKKKE